MLITETDLHGLLETFSLFMSIRIEIKYTLQPNSGFDFHENNNLSSFRISLQFEFSRVKKLRSNFFDFKEIGKL